MLNSRALALTNRDVAAYLAPLSPEAQLVETPFAQGALSVPVSGLHMKLEEEAHAGSRNRFESAKVEISFGYEGLAADNIFRLNVVYDLARTGTSWTASSSRIETSPDPPVWMTGPVEVKRSEHFLAFFRPGLASSQTALDRAEEARRRLQAKLPLTLDRAHLILLAHNRAEYEQLSAEDVPLSAVAQAETNFAISETSIAAEGRLIVVNLERLLTQSDAIEIFQHELAHLGLAAETRPFTPAWVGESAAMYLAGSRPILTWREGSRRGSFDHLSFSELTRAPALGQHDPTGASPSLEYAYAAAAAWYLVETFGEALYWSFYSSYAEIPASEIFARIPGDELSPATEAELIEIGAETTESSLMKVFRIDEAALDSRVRSWVAAQRG